VNKDKKPPAKKEETPAVPANFKGVGPPPKPSTPKKKAATSEFGKEELDNLVAEKGGEPFSIFIRLGPDERWLPAGPIAAPADRIAEAITDSQATLQTNACKRFPQLRGKEASFEYGYRPLDKLKTPVTAVALVKKNLFDRVKDFFKR